MFTFLLGYLGGRDSRVPCHDFLARRGWRGYIRELTLGRTVQWAECGEVGNMGRCLSETGAS